MKIRIKFFLIAACAIGILELTGCSPNNRDQYKIPPWLGGSSIETLEEAGNYSTFLELMDSADYRVPIQNQLFTLFVPDDAAFEAYFNKVDKNSVAELTKDEAVNLFTLHVLQNPRSRFLLIYEYVYSEFQGPDQGHNGEYMSLFHRKRTPSTTEPHKDSVRYFEDYKGQSVLVETGNKYVPLYTDEWFHDYGSFDAEGDYLFMYPNSKWREGYAGMPGTNWHNAMVLPHINAEDEEELEVRTANGFIYYVDQVVGPMWSIEEFLNANQDKYGLFYDILQRFAQYSSSGTDEQGRVLYTKSYDLVYDLAQETSASGPGGFPQNMWTAFVPSDQVLQKYLDDNILTYYPSIDSVPRVTLYYLLQTQLSRTAVLMSKMDRAYFNAFGDLTDITRNDLYPGIPCSNGIVYESKKILEPNVFTCVPRILFFDKNYSTMLFVLSEADMLITLANPDKDVTLLASTNEQLEEYGIRYDATNAVVEFRGPVDGKWSPMNNQNLVAFAQSQIITSPVSDYSGNGFIKTSSGTYLNYSNNVLQGPENQSSGNVANFVSAEENERNGYVIKVDRPIETRYVVGQLLAEDPDVSKFADLLVDFNMLNLRVKDPITKEIIPNLKFYAGAKVWTAFIPTNDAMQKAYDEGILPEGSGRNGLVLFLTDRKIQLRIGSIIIL